MAKTMTFGESDVGYDMSLWYDSRPLKIGWFTMLAAVGAEVVFQRVFGYSHGLDSMTPEFETVWMGLWRFNVISNIIFSASCPRVDLANTGSQRGQRGSQDRAQAVFLLHDVGRGVCVWRVLGRELHP